MNLFLKLKLLFSTYKQHEKIILRLNDKVKLLDEENQKLKNNIKTITDKNRIDKDGIVFKLKKEIDKLKEELERIKNELEYANKDINFKLIDKEIEDRIIKELSTAKKEVNIVVAWITSQDLINKLKELKDNNIVINIMITKDEEKEKKDYFIKSTDQLRKLADEFNIIEVKGKNNKYKHYMHNKYCVIDNEKVLDGSYNWSKNAMYNEEHIIVVESEIIAKLYKENYNRLIKEYTNNEDTLAR